MGKKILNVISGVVLVLMIALVVFIFISRASGKTPSIFGYHVFRVSSSSMEPALMVGDIILVKETSAEDIRLGDIITYNGTQGELRGKMITHRVIQEPELINGVYYIRTKGDKQGAAPDPQITFDQVEGKYVRTLPLVDKLYSFFLSPFGLIIFVLVIIGLFGYEIISLILSYRSIDEKDDDYYEPKNKKPSKKRKKPGKS